MLSHSVPKIVFTFVVMASVKLYARTDRVNADGTISIVLKIIHNRKNYKKTLYRIPEKMWDDKNMQVRRGVEDYIKINIDIQEEVARVRKAIMNAKLKKLPINPSDILYGRTVGDDIVSHLAARGDVMEEPRTKDKYNTVIMRINEAGMNTGIDLIDDQWIMKFESHLKKQGNIASTRNGYIAKIGAVLKNAKKKGIISINPLEGRQKNESPSKTAKLNLEEFRKMEQSRLHDEHLELIRKMWVFAVLARGMRAFDILTLTWDNINDGRLQYQAQKARSGKEGKVFDIKITDPMLECLEGLDRNTEYVFPFVKDPKEIYKRHKHYYKKHVASVLAGINSDLKIIAALCGIDKSISMHVARHTFAFIVSESKKPIPVIQQLLGHSDIATTIKYVNALRKVEELDEAVEGVF